MPNTLGRANPYYFGTSLNGQTPPVFRGQFPKDTISTAAAWTGLPDNIGGLKEDGWLQEDSTGNTWVAGDLLTLVSGFVRIATVTSTRLNGGIFGIAQEAATGVPYSRVYARLIRPDEYYVMNVMHTTAASATTAITQLGTVRGVRQDTVSGNGTLLWGVDIENAVEGSANFAAYVKIVGFPEKNPFDSGNLVAPQIGDIYGLVIVQFLPFSIFNTLAAFQRNLQLTM